jgi:hypothetical protein
VEPAGHAKLEKKGNVSLELKLDGLSPAKDGEDFFPAGIRHLSQALVQDQAFEDPGAQDDVPELAAQGFHFGQFGHRFFQIKGKGYFCLCGLS